MSTRGKILLAILIIVILGSVAYLVRGLVTGQWGVSAEVAQETTQVSPLSSSYRLSKGANFISVPFVLSAGSLERLGDVYTLENDQWQRATTIQPKPGIGYLVMADADKTVKLDPNDQAQVLVTEEIYELPLPLTSAGWFAGGNPFAKTIPFYNTTTAVKTQKSELTPGLWLKFVDSQGAKYLSIGQAVEQGWVYGPYQYRAGSDYIYIPNNPTLELAPKEGFLIYFNSLESTAGQRLDSLVYVSE